MTEAGTGGVVLVSGEMGMGKTSLVHAGLDRVHGGTTVLRSTAYPLAQDLSYAVIVHALDDYLGQLTQSRVRGLSADVPELSYASSFLRSLPPQDPDLPHTAFEKTHLFEAIVALLHRLSEDGPILWFLDDLHWADISSLQMLEYLIRRLESRPVLFILTYRSEELFFARSLRSLIVSVTPAFVLDELKLRRMNQDGVAEIVRQSLGKNVGMDIIEFLSDRSGGTPLFVVMMIEALSASQLVSEVDGVITFASQTRPTVIPDRIRDLVQTKVDRLTDEQRRILQILAVFGQSAAFKNLLGAAGLAEDTLVHALTDLIHANLVTEVADDVAPRFWFVHPMIQEAVYEGIPTVLRRSYHKHTYEALRQTGEANVAVLAAHGREALPSLDAAETIPIFLSAVDESFRVGAYEEAARDIGAILYFVRGGHRPELLPTLLERLGTAWHLCGEQDAAYDILQEALEAYTTAQNRRAMARVQCYLALCAYRKGDVHNALSHVESGIATLTGYDASPELLRLHSIKWTLLIRGFASMDQVLGAAHQLQEVTSQLNTQRARTLGLGVEAVVTLFTPNDAARHDMLLGLGQDSVEALQDSQEIIDFCVIKILYHLEFGDSAAARRWGQTSVAYAATAGVATAEQPAYPFVILTEYLSGDWKSALRTSNEALERRADGAARWSSLGFRALILAKMGHLARARACIEEARSARQQLLVGDGQSAIIEADIVDWMLRDEPMPGGDLERMKQAARAKTWAVLPGFWIASFAELLLNCGLPDDGMDVVGLLMVRAKNGFPLSQAFENLITGLHFVRTNRVRAGLSAIHQAAQDFEALRMPYEAHRALALWCTHAASHGRSRQEVIGAATKCLEFFDNMEASLDADNMRACLRSFNIARPSPAKPARQVLSRREHEIATLVAKGMSNADIASQLVISVRTVTTHLERIYERMGLHNRSSLTRFVVENGLTNSQNT